MFDKYTVIVVVVDNDVLVIGGGGGRWGSISSFNCDIMGFRTM